MTNNQHGQVPEALIDLIDAYAETRHRCGGIYNARTEAARKAVIEALSGVQAQPAPAPLSDDAKDAARYRWLRDTSNADDPSHMIALHIREEQNDASLSGIDAAIDAALAAQGGK